jgi:murein hydrolase activator
MIAMRRNALPTTRLTFLAALILAVGAGAAGPVCAEPPAPNPAETADTAAQKAARERELAKVKAEQQKAAEAETNLRKEIEALSEDRRKFNQALIDTAAQVRTKEDSIAAAEARLQGLEADQKTARASLENRRGAILEVVAALQRLGRAPPPAILVRPEDALSSVRAAMLLGAVLPEMRREVEKLAENLAELARLKAAIAQERDDLTRDLLALSRERLRMSFLIEERQRKQSAAETALEAQRQHAQKLAQEAESLKELIAKLEQDLALSARAAASAPAPETKDARSTLAALKDPGRLTPAVAFAATKGNLPLPVNGVRLREFGAPDGVGGVEKGLWIASRAAAQVTAPCDGWVVYAGPFRSYGQLLILNAGGGYHVLLAGMERISVDLGQFVLTGEPVAVMGGGPQSAATVAVGSGQPALYVEFRKDGTPIDPSPWWAASDSERVRG